MSLLACSLQWRAAAAVGGMRRSILGPKLRFEHAGGGSIWRLAMRWLRGPKVGRGQRRQMTQKEARQRLKKMTPEELADVASCWARLLSAKGALACVVDGQQRYDALLAAGKTERCRARHVRKTSV